MDQERREEREDSGGGAHRATEWERGTHGERQRKKRRSETDREGERAPEHRETERRKKRGGDRGWETGCNRLRDTEATVRREGKGEMSGQRERDTRRHR